MKKIILSIILLGGVNANAQQLLEVLRPHTIPTPNPNQAVAQVWDRTHYVISFNHNGANIDGTLSNTGFSYNALTLFIPYNEATVGKSYDEINITRTAIDRFGNPQTLTLHIPAGTFNTAKGILQAAIKVGNGTTDVFKVKQLNANEEEIIASFNFSMGGRTSTVRLVANGGILDRKFNTPTDGELKHQFVYMPMSIGTDGSYDVNSLVPEKGKPFERTFLMTNLGAEVSNVNSPPYQYDGECKQQGVVNFFPVENPSCFPSWMNGSVISAFYLEEEFLAGSLFQWQRPADGHELVKWKLVDASSGNYDPELTPVVNTRSSDPNWIAGHSNFISQSDSPSSWVTSDVYNNTNNLNLWQKNGANNPCPTDYYVPTMEELQEMNKYGFYALLLGTYYDKSPMYYDMLMGFLNHVRGKNGTYEGINVDYGPKFWTSTPISNPYTGQFLKGASGMMYVYPDTRISHIAPPNSWLAALPVRCIREE